MQEASVQQASIVYGYIRAAAAGQSALDAQRQQVNLLALDALPMAEDAHLVHRGMFGDQSVDGGAAVQVIHFGACRPGLEYQWDNWIEQFEVVLRRMCWSRVTVHLETQALGTHTFVWVASCGDYSPGGAAFEECVQRLWQRSGALY